MSDLQATFVVDADFVETLPGERERQEAAYLKAVLEKNPGYVVTETKDFGRINQWHPEATDEHWVYRRDWRLSRK